MNHLVHWFTMGGYAAYVWPAYGCVGAVFITNFVMMKTKKAQVQRKLQHWFES
jgi:heme exporter protein D